MIDGFTNAQIIAALIAVLMASYAAFFGWLVTSIGALRRDMHALNRETRQDLGGRIDVVEAKLGAKIDTVDTKLSAKIERAHQRRLATRRRRVSRLARTTPRCVRTINGCLNPYHAQQR